MIQLNEGTLLNVSKCDWDTISRTFCLYKGSWNPWSLLSSLFKDISHEFLEQPCWWYNVQPNKTKMYEANHCLWFAVFTKTWLYIGMLVKSASQIVSSKSHFSWYHRHQGLYWAEWSSWLPSGSPPPASSCLSITMLLFCPHWAFLIPFQAGQLLNIMLGELFLGVPFSPEVAYPQLFWSLYDPFPFVSPLSSSVGIILLFT